MTLCLFLDVLALVLFFIAAAFNAVEPYRVRLVAAGLFLVTLCSLFGGVVLPHLR